MVAVLRTSPERPRGSGVVRTGQRPERSGASRFRVPGVGLDSAKGRRTAKAVRRRSRLKTEPRRCLGAVSVREVTDDPAGPTAARRQRRRDHDRSGVTRFGKLAPEIRGERSARDPASRSRGGGGSPRARARNGWGSSFLEVPSDAGAPSRSPRPGAGSVLRFRPGGWWFLVFGSAFRLEGPGSELPCLEREPARRSPGGGPHQGSQWNPHSESSSEEMKRRAWPRRRRGMPKGVSALLSLPIEPQREKNREYPQIQRSFFV